MLAWLSVGQLSHHIAAVVVGKDRYEVEYPDVGSRTGKSMEVEE